MPPGYDTVLMAGLEGASGRVSAAEPHPAIPERLRRTVRLNGFDIRVGVRSAPLRSPRRPGGGVAPCPAGLPQNTSLHGSSRKGAATGALARHGAGGDRRRRPASFVKIDAEGRSRRSGQAWRRCWRGARR